MKKKEKTPLKRGKRGALEEMETEEGKKFGEPRPKGSRTQKNGRKIRKDRKRSGEYKKNERTGK